MAQGGKERSGEQNRSKSVAWNEPLRLIQSMNRRKEGKKGSQRFRQKDGKELISRRPSKWANFCRMLGVHRRSKVHAERELPGCFFWTGPESVSYDSQNYALNFEEERDSPSTSPQMPIVSGPEAREIVTLFLTRNPSTKRNLGSILIPKPTILAVKQEANLPLWMRRGVSTPAPLHIRTGYPSIHRPGDGRRARITTIPKPV